jgi:hypothetical protein
MSRKKAVLSEKGFVDKLMELDNYVHWLATVRALKKSKNTIPIDAWTAILYKLLRFAGTKRAIEIIGYEKDDRKTGIRICSNCRGEYCTKHCTSCAGDLEMVAGERGAKCCHKCRIQFFFSGFGFGQRGKAHHVIRRVAFISEAT